MLSMVITESNGGNSCLVTESRAVGAPMTTTRSGTTLIEVLRSAIESGYKETTIVYRSFRTATISH
jgi:hypothetical protein